MVPRGIRNNNPGNIRITKDKWQGLREGQTDVAFFQFTEMKWGYRAMLRTLQNYRWRHNRKTIAEIIERWAPPVENETSAYVLSVCKQLQVPTTFVPDVEDKDEMCALAAAISYHENGVEPNMEDIRQGWDLL